MQRERLCRSHSAGLALFALLFLLGRPARADIDLAALSRSTESALPRVLGPSVGVVTELPEGREAPAGFVSIGTTSAGTRLGVLDLGADALADFAGTHPDLGLTWAPPRRLMLDRADGFVRASAFRNDTGLSGRGVVVGLLDTGIDPTHPDLRESSLGTRVAYWLDFSRERMERHPELEDELGCRTDPDDDTAVPCAVLTGTDVDELLANGDPDDDPNDPIGHGTHVASLAAGNGRSESPARFVGVAPEATLVVARVTRRGGGIFDTDVLKAARFVFERAAELGMPAVLNLSLGGDFGGHDGSSGLERGLSSLVGAEHPGRAIVVAAGNSAGLYTGLYTGVPEPLGIHTSVHVPDGASALVPIVTPPTSRGITQGAIYAWVGTRAGDALAIGVDDRSGPVTSLVRPGTSGQFSHDDVEITIVNDLASEAGVVPRGTHGAAIMISGTFPSSNLFGLRFEGPGTASLWVEGDGPLSPARSVGPLLPRAERQGTVSIPASAAGLIAVGATLNRTDWIDYAGEAVTFSAFGALDPAPPDTSAYFSGAGPSADGTLKPDLVAPGGNLIGALAHGADPRAEGAGGLFDDGERCTEAGFTAACSVVSDLYAVTSGTSMAAPLVTGAIALLFERDPTLDQDGARALLQAGTRPLGGVVLTAQQVGPGALDLEQTLQVAEAGSGDAPARLPGSESRLVLGDALAHPDPAWPLTGLAVLRDDGGRIADGFDERRLTLALDGGSAAPGLGRVAPGLYRFGVVTPSGSGGRRLTVSLVFDGHTLSETTVPIAVDPSLAASLPSALGGCRFVAGSGRHAGGWVLVAGALALGLSRRRASGRRER